MNSVWWSVDENFNCKLCSLSSLTLFISGWNEQWKFSFFIIQVTVILHKRCSRLSRITIATGAIILHSYLKNYFSVLKCKISMWFLKWTIGLFNTVLWQFSSLKVMIVIIEPSFGLCFLIVCFWDLGKYVWNEYLKCLLKKITLH